MRFLKATLRLGCCSLGFFLSLWGVVDKAFGAWPNELQDWSHRIILEVHPPSTRTEVLVDFPVYVDLSGMPETFFSEIGDGGRDIRVTTIEGVVLQSEVVFVDEALKRGELHFKAPQLNLLESTNFFIYFGNEGASTTQSGDLWSQYDIVMHLHQAPTGTGGDVVNSRGTANGSSHFTSELPLVPGRLAGDAFDFVSSNETWVDLPDVLANLNQFSISFWVEGATFDDGREVFYGSSAGWYLLVWGDNENGYEVIVDSETRTRIGSNIFDSGWNHITATWDGADLRIFVNGVWMGKVPYARGPLADKAVFRLGGEADYKRPSNSTIDEFRVSANWHGPAWVETEYMNQDGPESFYTIGPTVEIQNSPPVLGEEIVAPNAVMGQLYQLTVPSLAFSDPDGDPLTWSVIQVPAWIKSVQGVPTSPPEISGTPSYADIETSHVVRIAVTDPSHPDDPVEATFNIYVEDAEGADYPVVLTSPVAVEGSRIDLNGKDLVVENRESAGIRFESGGALRMSLGEAGGVVIEGNAQGPSLAVKGEVKAAKVVVKADWWADYVFDSDYDLVGLEEVREHIAQHGRLPGVPSSSYVQEHGISVGDTQAILLRKIEELTLYMIEQEKQIRGLSREIETLRSINNELEATLDKGVSGADDDEF